MRSSPALSRRCKPRQARGFPIVIAAVNFDPIAHGYVKSLSRPGGNVTGVVLRQTELAEKQVELLTQAFPERKATGDAMGRHLGRSVQRGGAPSQGARADVISIKFEKPPYDIAAAFRRMTEGGAQMLLTLSSPFLGPAQPRPSST